VRCLFALTISINLASSMSAEKPFDFAATPGKLPKEVVPTEYWIRIVPKIDKLAFSGTETVKLEVHRPVRELVLNALEIEIASASIDEKPVSQDAVKIDNKNERARIALPSELPTGAHTLSLDFSGKINQQGRGLFYMRYQEQGSGAKRIAVGTQFEPTDARRLFPCWDEPSFRARFQLTAVVPENWLAVSNMPVGSEKKFDNPEMIGAVGKKSASHSPRPWRAI
jgi:aminopeptidase N